MKLNLKNIKQHADYTIEFPDTGLVLLKGPSGRGKTSILEAINFGLFDGEDLLGWDKKSASLTMEWRNRTIVRTIGPDSLALATGEKDAAAQSIISNDLGMSAEEFSASSYIRQDEAESLLNLKPTAQLAFIQRLISGDLDIDKIREKARVLINTNVVTLERANQNITRLVQEKVAIENKLSGISGELQVVDPVSDQEFQQAMGKVACHKKELDSLRAIKQKHVLNLSHPAHKFRAEYEANKNNLIDQMTKAEEELNALLVLTTQVKPWADKSREEVASQLSRLSDERLYLDFKRDFAAFRDAVNSTFPCTAGAKIITALKEIRDRLATDRTRMADTIGNLNIRLGAIRIAKSSMFCPNCASALKFDGKKLVCQTDDANFDVDQEPVLNHEIQQIMIEQRKAAEQIAEVEKYLTLGNQLQRRKESFANIRADVSVDQIGEEQVELTRYIELQTHIEAGITIRNKDIEQKKKTLELARMKLKSLSGMSAEYAKVDNLETIQTHIDVVETGIDSENINLAKAEEACACLTTQRHAREIYEMKLAAQNEVLAAHEAKLAEIASSSSEVLIIESDVAAANKVHDIVRKASVEAVADIVLAINSNAAYFVSRMFPEGETSVVLRNSRQLKNGDEKPELSIVITHKGAKVKKLRSLSGGEKARLTLAFQLALSNLYKSPILLVDEACSGLDEESKEKCFDILKEVAQSKLVICVEHGAAEHLFDQIVEV